MIREVAASLWEGWSVAQGFPSQHVNHPLTAGSQLEGISGNPQSTVSTEFRPETTRYDSSASHGGSKSLLVPPAKEVCGCL